MLSANILIILISVSLNALAQLFLKQGASIMSHRVVTSQYFRLLLQAMNLPMFLGFLCYGLSIGLWIWVLSKVDVSTAYPFQALGYIIVLFLSYIFFHEPLTWHKVIGVMLISMGVVLIAMNQGQLK